MNLKIQFSNKTKAYVLRVIVSGALALTIGLAGAGQTLQAAAASLARGETRIAPDLGLVSAQDASSPRTRDISARSQTSQGSVGSMGPDSVTILPPASPVSDVNTFPGRTFNTIPFTDTVDTTGATPNTSGIDDPTPIVSGDCNSTQSEASVWYRYTSTANTRLFVDTLGSNYDTLLAVWTGNSDETNPGNLTLVACNDDIGTYEIQSKLGFFAQSGKTYFIEVIEWTESQSLAQGSGGILNFHIEGSNGADTTGVFRPSNGLLYLKNSNTTGFADVAINYGTGGDYPVTGDWDGNGTDTIGIYRNGSFYLRNSNTLGFADLVFAFGTPGDQPIAGDWNGDGVDTIGVYRPSTGQFLLRNSNTAGAADMSFYLGNVGDVGIAGDWDGNGIDTTGVFRPSNGVIFLKNQNTTGFADIALNYGIPGDRPVTGDWNNNGIDTIGVYRNGQFLLRNSNTVGFADIVFGLGNPGDMPIAGNWDGLP